MNNVPINSSNLKSKVDQLDFDKLVHVPVDLRKLSDIVKNDVFKRDLYNSKIKSIEEKIPSVNKLPTNASLNAKVNEVKGKIPYITNLPTNAPLNAKINEVKGKIPNIPDLGLIAVNNKIPSVSNIVKKIQP